MTKANVGERRDAATGGHAFDGHAAGGDTTGDRCDSCDKPPPHDDRAIFQASPVELPDIDIHSLGGIPCRSADGPREERFQGYLAP